MEQILLATALIVGASVLLVPLAARTGAPLLLLFLGIGMLLGIDGPGGIDFHNFEAAFTAGSIALAIILFAGGLETPLSSVRRAGAPALLMATVGVMVTALVVALVTHWLTGLP
ncbi:cation:proton antiporter, partial [Arthrospira platensis SPKY2]